MGEAETIPLDQGEAPFYAQLRESVVLLLSFLSVYALALVVLQKWLRPCLHASFPYHPHSQPQQPLTVQTPTIATPSAQQQEHFRMTRKRTFSQVQNAPFVPSPVTPTRPQTSLPVTFLRDDEIGWWELRRGARSPVVLIAGLALAMSWSSLLILPMTISANEILLHFANNYYVRWLDASLVLGYWNWIFVGCNVCLFVALPFAYFYTEAEDPITVLAAAAEASAAASSHNPNAAMKWYAAAGMGKRMRESLLVLALTGSLLFALTYAIKRILYLESLSSLVVLNGFSCLASALLCIRAAPRGLSTLLRWVKSLALPPNYRTILQDQLAQLQMEEEVLRTRLTQLAVKTSPSSRVSWKKAPMPVPTPLLLPSAAAAAADVAADSRPSPTTPDDRHRQLFQRNVHRASEQERLHIISQLARLDRKKTEIARKLSISVWARNFYFVLAMTAVAVLTGLFLAQLGLNIVKGVVYFLATLVERMGEEWIAAQTGSPSASRKRGNLSAPGLEDMERFLGQTTSYLGLFGSMLELLLVLYFCGICLLGAFWPVSGDGGNASEERKNSSAYAATTAPSKESPEDEVVAIASGPPPDPFASTAAANPSSSSTATDPPPTLSDDRTPLLTQPFTSFNPLLASLPGSPSNAASSRLRIRTASIVASVRALSRPSLSENPATKSLEASTTANPSSRRPSRTTTATTQEERSTPTQWLLLNLTLLLILTSSMPSLVRLIGITRFDPIGYYAIFGAMNDWVVLGVVYKLVLLFLMVRSALPNVQWSRWLGLARLWEQRRRRS